MSPPSARNRLLENAEAVFLRKGFNGASVQDITRAADVPKGSFYDHFAGKQDLAVDIVQRYAGDTDLSPLEGNGSAVGRLRAYLLGELERTRTAGVEFGCLLGTFASDSATAGDRVREAVGEALASRTDSLARTIEEGRTAGDVTASRPAGVLAAFLIDASQGAFLRAETTVDQSIAVEETATALDALRP
ncbi:TetR/AcrR family transcriptional regulator [Streptomyces pseudogriseolus]|uniref:TetR/AcrR family transcriptional regulator n=1 Tax=Streptomyces pseudogriseolus TaxID=36817 RepID=UPI003FA22F3A